VNIFVLVMTCYNLFRFAVNHNRRQKVDNKGALRSCKGDLKFKFDKNSTKFYCFIFQLGGWLGALFGEAQPTNAPVVTGLLST